MSTRLPLVLIATMAVLSSLARAAPIEVRILVDAGFYPYTWEDSGKTKGAYVEVLQSAGKRLPGYRLVLQAVPWKRALHAMEFDSAFAILPTYKREKLRPWMDYTLPLYVERIVPLMNTTPSSSRKTRWPQDFLGNRIGLNDGFVALEQWKDQIVIEPVRSNEQALRMLLASRIDAYVNDEAVMLSSVRRMQKRGTIPPGAKFTVGPTISTEPTFLSLTTVARGRYPWMEDFRRKMASELERMRASGEIDRIVKRYTN